MNSSVSDTFKGISCLSDWKYSILCLYIEVCFRNCLTQPIGQLIVFQIFIYDTLICWVFFKEVSGAVSAKFVSYADKKLSSAIIFAKYSSLLW